MNPTKPSEKQFPLSTRRGFFRNAAGAGAGLVLGSEIGVCAAGEPDEDKPKEALHPSCPVVPRPIPHINHPPGPGAHFFFPGPVEGTPTPVDPTAGPLASRDPSIITDFSGVIGQADLNLSGVGTDLITGHSAQYDFHTDMRFMSGIFVGLDNELHRGTVGFI